MGGKSYFCDYCRCYLKNDINVRKTHNSGLTHKIAKANYMRRYEDPRKILKEERAKTPCTRFPKGYCKFGLFCQFTHYSQNQLCELEEIVRNLEQQSQNNDTNNQLQIHEKRKRKKHKYKKLPISLRATNYKTITSIKHVCQWG